MNALFPIPRSALLFYIKDLRFERRFSKDYNSELMEYLELYQGIWLASVEVITSSLEFIWNTLLQNSHMSIAFNFFFMTAI